MVGIDQSFFFGKLNPLAFSPRPHEAPSRPLASPAAARLAQIMASQSGGICDDDDYDNYDDDISVPAPTIVRGNATARYRNSSVTTAAPPAVKEMASTKAGWILTCLYCSKPEHS